jgi:alkylated DNA repair protein (DNA oxidative demethylase)
MVNEGLKLVPGYLTRPAQEALLRDIAEIAAAAPFYTPTMPRSGRPFSVEMTNAGPLGWVSDRVGYRYQGEHPVTGAAWPDIPQAVLAAWQELSGFPAPPQCCLVNRYGAAKSKMGLHRDEDEEDFSAPVVSLSLGDTALYRIGGLERKGPTSSFRLASGDVLVLGGPSRLRYHGIDRIYPSSSTLVPGGGRINLTLRRVTPPADS